jgi:Aspartate/tyrosine/aromatic aminotransferase
MLRDWSMVAPHSKRTAAEDEIFKLNREAQQASKIFGSDKVINASLGSLFNDDGKLAILPTVIDILRNLDAEDFSAYAPIAGLPDFLKASQTAAFRDCTPEGYIEAVATPGGTGAVRHTIWNYSEMGDTVLTADWYWGPYKTICEEHGRKLETFSLFDEHYNLNIGSFENKLQELAKVQERIVILLNSPANNPTGYNLSDSEWDEVILTLKETVNRNDTRITLFIDIAYIDYSGEAHEARKFMTKLGNLPDNILIVFGFSMSKSFTLYGMRCGSMIGLSSNKMVAEEFRSANEFSNRGVWSNGTRPAMVVLTKIYSDSVLFKKVEAEREILRYMLSSRAEAFKREAGISKLTICPYKAGFFISIPCSSSNEVVERLKKDNIFAVPTRKGIRFAVCSVPEDKCRIVPSRVSDALNSIK